MNQNGIFITFEGIDGAGKSSHLDALACAFEAQGRAVVRTREPGGTELAEKLRPIILTADMDALTEVLLIFAARRDHLQQCIEPALKRGQVVISDRFTDATFAYQGGGRGCDWQALLQLEQLVQSSFESDDGGVVVRQPDLTLWFELAPEIAAKRLAAARAPDRFEAEDVAFFARVSAAYQRRRLTAPQRFAVIDAAQTRPQVWQQVRYAVQSRGWLA